MLDQKSSNYNFVIVSFLKSELYYLLYIAVEILSPAWSHINLLLFLICLSQISRSVTLSRWTTVQRGTLYVRRIQKEATTASVDLDTRWMIKPECASVSVHQQFEGSFTLKESEDENYITNKWGIPKFNLTFTGTRNMKENITFAFGFV